MKAFSFSRTAPPKNEGAVVVADLDKIVATTVSFRLHGVIRVIKPIGAEQFFRYAEALGNLVQLKERPLADQKAFLCAFFEVVKNVAEPITLEDLEKCTLQQIAALYATILDCVTGKADQGESVEKKN